MEEETVQPNNQLTDQVLQEIEKISELEKKQKKLLNKTNNLKHRVDEISKKEEEEEQEKNVIKEEEVSPVLTNIEKKRYQIIGEEFMKGADEVFQQIKKAQELKEKMSTKSKEVQQIQKLEEDQKKNVDKKGKVSPFLVIGIAIAAVAGILYVFRDKLKKVFDESSSLTSGISSLTSNLGNFGSTIIEQVLGLFSGEMQSFFSPESGPLYQMIDAFFTKTLPNSIKYAGVHLISLFSESAGKSLEHMADTTNTKSDTEVDTSVRLNQYDETGARQNSAMRAGAAGATEAQQRAMLGNLGVTSVEHSLRPVLLGFMNQDLFAGATTESERMAIAFQEKTYNIKAFMQEFASSTDEEIVQMRQRMREGRATAEDQERFTQMLAGHFGRTADDAFRAQVASTFFSSNSQGNLDALIKSADTFIQETERIENGIAASRASMRASEGRINARESFLRQRGEIHTLDIEPATLVGTEFASETKKVADLVANMIDGHSSVASRIIEATGTFIKNFLSQAFDTVLPLITGVMRGLPFIDNMTGLVYSGQSVDLQPTHYSNEPNAQQTTMTQQYQRSNVFDAANSDRPLVLVALSLDGEVLSKFTRVNENAVSTLESLKNTNTTLARIVEEIEHVKKLTGESASTNHLGIFEYITYYAEEVNQHSQRIGHIEEYLEAQDGVGDDGKTKDFVLQATGS